MSEEQTTDAASQTPNGEAAGRQPLRVRQLTTRCVGCSAPLYAEGHIVFCAYPACDYYNQEVRLPTAEAQSTPSQRETRCVNCGQTREYHVVGGAQGDYRCPSGNTLFFAAPLAPSEAGGREEAYRTARDIFAEGDFDAVVALIEDRRALESLRARLASRPSGEDSARLDMAQRLLFSADFQYQTAEGPRSVVVLLVPDGVRVGGDFRKFLDAARASEGSPS